MNSAAAARDARDQRVVSDRPAIVWGMDDDGPAETGRTRLARGTKPNALTGKRELADGADTMDGALVPGAARSGPPPASVAFTGRDPVRRSDAPDTTRCGPVPAGMEARGSGPVAAGGAPGGAGHAPAQSIHEAVEQLIEAQEADEAVAEWMRGGG